MLQWEALIVSISLIYIHGKKIKNKVNEKINNVIQEFMLQEL
jgi:hypothetical protein